MGYRNYLYKIKKSDYVDGRQEWDYEDGLIEELYELGKYVDSEIRDGLIILSEAESVDGEFDVIDIESIPHIISHYSKKQLNFLNSLKDGTSHQYDFESYIDDQIRKWSHPDDFIYDLNKEKENIVNSWEFQYEIFDLIRIYKTFDSEKYYLLWVGY